MDISKSSGYKDFLRATKLYCLSLDLVGLWPKTDEIVKRRFGSDIRAGFTLILLVHTACIPLLYELTQVWGDMTLMIDNLRITLPMLMVLLKLLIMRWKQSVLASVINMIKEDWMTLNLDAERNVMIKRIRTTRLIVICVYVLTVFTLIGIIIFPCFGFSFRRLRNITNQNRPLILQTYYFYDTDKSPQFELTYLIQVIGSFLIMIVYTSVDTFFGFVICHICGQLENFRRRLVNLIAGKQFNKALSNNVVTHLRLIRFVDNIEDIFTLMIFISIIYFAIVFCLAGFVLLVVFKDEKINAQNLSEIYYAIAVSIIFIIEMFFYCYAGELLTEQSEAIYRAMYDLEWYKWEAKQARNLIILMIRIQEPLRITAGKIIPLTMTTFCSLLKTSVGYISFLMTIQD